LTKPATSSDGEREHLLTLLAALEDPPRATQLPLDDPSVIRVARHHRLSPLLSATCDKFLLEPLRATFRHDRLITSARNMILGQIAEECLRALADARIQTIVLKGLDYETRLYGIAGIRPTADVDLLVPEEKRRQAFAVLDSLGFEPRAAAPGFDDPDYHEVAWTRRGIEIDLHMAFTPLVRGSIDYTAVWASAQAFELGQVPALHLCGAHAAVFHTLHMAIDHFDVPAIYLVDLTRLLPDLAELAHAETAARSWQCHYAFTTAVALTSALLPRWISKAPARPMTRRARRVIGIYGATSPLPRTEQLIRKFSHFDTIDGAFRYLIVQSKRNLREGLERRLRKRSARERLSL
jgi:hypothetical protein